MDRGGGGVVITYPKFLRKQITSFSIVPFLACYMNKDKEKGH